MNKNTLLVIGLIGGILAAVGVFLPWASAYGVSVSGWDVTSAGSYPYVILVGGIIALLGSLVALLAIKIKNISYLILLGGIIAILGWIWAAIEVTDWSLVSYGFYVCLVGSILALIGSMSVRCAKK
ncbi:MAG: hypothetical protein AVW06_01615 [Hadesarchaea archaeon DG-33-1]|nr:MAG: hypothetical protein AVW06_01615 [Hadesarchaea archaeon DG-33-1]